MQRHLAEQVQKEPFNGPIQRVAGVDVSNNLRDPEGWIYAAIVVLSWPALTVLETATDSFQSTFPYIPGFLGFREAPALVQAYAQLTQKPDVLFVDGHGVSHPRGLGIASHLGVLLDCPAIGVAKSILVGKPAREPGPMPGDQAPLVWKGQEIATVLRTRKNTNPLYISVGHRLSQTQAVEWVLAACKGYRLPEPTRQAHLAANVLRKSRLPAGG